MPANLDGTVAVNSTFRALKFEIVPFIGRKGAQYREGLMSTSCIRNSIVITGMTTDRPLPADPIPRGWNWFYNSVADVPIGTVYLSRKSFLDGVILKITEHVNHETTIVPVWLGINNDRWIFELKKWDDHVAKFGLACNWRELTAEDNVNTLEFTWRNKELWNYENDYDDDFAASFRCKHLSPYSQISTQHLQVEQAIVYRYRWDGWMNSVFISVVLWRCK